MLKAKSYKSFLLYLTIIKVIAGEMRFSNSYQEHLKVMSSLLDDFYDPCEDFYNHACGNYDTQVAPIARFMSNKESYVKFFEENRKNFTTIGGILLNGLYESCKQKNWDISQWKSIDFLEEFTKWPFLHYQWAQSGIETSWSNLTAQLASKGIPIFFDMFFAKNTIYSSPAYIRCPAKKEEIKALIMSPATSVLSNQVADIISSELLLFCQNLLDGSTEKPDTNGSSQEATEFSNIFFQALNLTAEEIENARKINIKTERVEEIFSIIRKTEPRIVINFIIWKMLEYLEYNDCFQITDEFEKLLLSEYWHWGAFKTKLKKKVTLASFFYLNTRFQKHRKDKMYSKDWQLSLDKKLRRKHLNLERIIKAYVNNNLSRQSLADDYSGLVMKRNSFFQNYFQMKRRQLRLSFLQDNYVDKEDPNHPANLVRKFINFAILSFGEQPLFHYFATEGFDLWYNSDLFTTDELYTAVDCLDRQSTMYSEEIHVNLTVVEIENLIRFNRAFYQSLNDYMFWLEGEKFSFAEDSILENFNLHSSEVLFYSVAQLFCGRDVDSTKHSSFINRSFMNSFEFQDAFKCDYNTPMNPPAKCMCNDC